MLHPIICAAKHNRHAYSFNCLSPCPHSHPPQSMNIQGQRIQYINHSGASINGTFPTKILQTSEVSLVSPFRSKTEDKFYFQRERERFFYSLSNSSDDSVSEFENVTDFYYSNITNAKHRMKTEEEEKRNIPVRADRR